MVTKGIITEIINKYQARVRIPIYNKAEESPTATPNEELSIGPVSTLPGISPNISVGDIVIIAFEQDIYTDPVILGLLYTENSSRGFSDIKAGKLGVVSEAVLPFKTTIGDVTGDQIFSLKDVKGNVQNQLDLLNDKLIDISDTGVFDVKVAGSSVVTDGIANIPYASTSQAGVVSTEAQTFSGQKSFNGVTAFNGNVVFNDLSDGGSVTVEIDSNAAAGITKWAFKQGSPSGSRTDIYYLPTTSNSDTNGTYNILTTKNVVTVAQGGTGATTAADARTNLEITPANIGAATANHNHEIQNLINFSTRVYDAAESRTANTVLAAPNGSDGVASFRQIVSEDITGPLSTTYFDASTAAQPSAGRFQNLPTGHSRLYGNALCISNPTTTNDQGWIRVTGTAESDTILEIATGDDSGAGEQIVARQYSTSNTVAHELVLMNTSGDLSSSNRIIGGGGSTVIGKYGQGNYGENIRCNLNSDSWAAIVMGGASGSTEGTGSGIYGLYVNGGNFAISHNSSSTYILRALSNGTNTFYGSVTGTAEGISAAGQANFLTRQAWWGSTSGQNVNDLRGGSTFVYTTHGAPTNGTMVALDCSGNTNYTSQLIMGYNDGTMHWRARNGDNATWSGWKAATPMVGENGYWGLKTASGGEDWIRTTQSGLIPYQSGGVGSGHCGLGTSSWYFSYAYIDSVFVSSYGTGFKCRNISYGSGDPSGGSSGDVYIKFV